MWFGTRRKKKQLRCCAEARTRYAGIKRDKKEYQKKKKKEQRGRLEKKRKRGEKKPN